MPHLKVNSKLEPFIRKPKPIKVAFGGRASGKSVGIADILLLEMATKGYDVLCLREHQENIEDSVHKVFKKGVQERLKLEGWDLQANKIIAPNTGAYTRYMGANRNPESIKSAESFLRSWFEEAQTASQESLDKLIPTVLRRPNAECWFTANPKSSADPFSKRFIVPFQAELDRDGYYEDDLHLIIKVNWRDNPWYDDIVDKIRRYDKENKTSAEYMHIWEGAFNDHVENGLIQSEWFDACVDAHLKLGFLPAGAEVVAHDPSDMGQDAKTLVHRHGSVILQAKELTKGDIHDGIEWALQYAIANRVDMFVWDEDGMGGPLRKEVKEKLAGRKIDFQGYSGGGAVEDPDRPFEPKEGANPKDAPKLNRDMFYNRRMQQYYRLASRIYRTYQAVVKGRYHNPDDLISFSSEIEALQKLKSELCRLPLKNNGAGKMQLKTKEEMQRDGIPSPNLGDACKMALINPPLRAKVARPSYVKW